MRMVVAAVCLVFALVFEGCSSDSTTTPTASVTYVTDTLSGTVPAAVNGVAQTDFKTFSIASSGTITAVLTAAVETFPGGAVNASVVMGAGLGTPSGNTCTVLSSTYLGQASGSPIFQLGVQTGGSYCVQMTNLDVSTQSGPVAYTVLVSHPQ